MAKKIRIVKAEYPSYWYADKIGKVYEVAYETEHNYFVKGVGELSPGLLKTDVEEVIEHNSQLYRKVDRPVREGDKVLITKINGERYGNEIRKVAEVDIWYNVFTLGEEVDGYEHVELYESDDDKYFVLELIEQPVQPSAPSYAEVSELLHEAKLSDVYTIDEVIAELDKLKQPNDIVTHNGKQYRKVKRKASVGELVVVTDFKPDKHIPDFEDTKNGDVFTAVYLWDDGDVETSEDDGVILGTDEYSVLEPIEQSGQTETLTERDLIANLAQEVAELKRQLTNAQTDIADLEDRVDESEKDVEEVIGRMNDLGDGAEVEAVVPVEVIEKVITELDSLKGEALDEADTFNYNGMVEQYESEAEAKAYGKAIGLLREALRNA